MINQKKTVEILAVWANLKSQILSLKPFLKNKSLIIAALEIHLNQASSFTSENSSAHLLEQRGLKREKELLTKELERLARWLEDHPSRSNLQHFDSERERINNQLLAINQALNDNSIQAAFNRQKEKNEQIVKECQELLRKLQEFS